MMLAERFCLKSRAANVAMITVVLLLNVSSRAQILPAAAPLTPEPLRPGWDQIDERLVFLAVRLSSVETSIAAVDKAVKATGYSKSLRAEDAEHARMGNELMDRKGGGPVPWQDFYGRTAKDFYFHPGSAIQVHSISGSLRETDIQAEHTDTPIAVDRPPQLAYIYRANSDNQKRAEAAIAELGGKIDQLLERRRQLESEQSALWSEIAFQAVASRDLASKPLYRFNLKSSQPDPAADHVAAAGAACDFVRTVNQLMDDAQKDVETDPGPVFHQFSQAISTARKTLNDRLTDQESIALDLSDPQSKISKVTAAAKRLDDLARNMDESYRLAHDGDVAGDDQRKNTFRGLLQDGLLNTADTLLTADQCVLDLAKDWKLTPDVKRPATQPSAHLDLPANKTDPATLAGETQDTAAAAPPLPDQVNTSVAPGDRPAANRTTDPLTGKWCQTLGHYTVTLNPDGTASSSMGNDGTWTVNGEGTVVKVQWNLGGWVEVFEHHGQKWVKYAFQKGVNKHVNDMTPPGAVSDSDVPKAGGAGGKSSASVDDQKHAFVDSPPARGDGGGTAWKLDNISQYEKIKLVPSWQTLPPKTTIGAQKVNGSLVLTRQDSPYLVTGLLLIPSGATLTIEPGAVVLFAPQTKVENQGTLTAVSDGPWIVLANSDPSAGWSGVYSSGKIKLRRCLTTRAAHAFSTDEGSLSAAQCIFAANDDGLSFGNGGHGTVQDSLFFRNRTGPYGHGDFGSVRFSKCLLLFNKRGCSANFSGKCEGDSSTFYGNDTAVEAAERGDSVRIALSNILTTNGKPLGSRGGKAVVAGNYWGNEVPTDPKYDISGPLQAPVKHALPNLPTCEYLTLE